MNPRVVSVEFQPPDELLLTFNNHEIRVFNLSDYLTYPVYEKLNDPGYCRKAKVLNGTVVWDNETDFDPDTLYLESRPLPTHVK